MLETVAPEKRLDFIDQKLSQKRQVKLKTCADVYNYWRNCKKRFYKRAPKDGVEFQIDYIDTGLALAESVRATAPIALALHGAPGSYHDYALLIHHLTQQNVRVIAPNFPEYTATVRTKVLFRHSADEKAAYLRDFLKAINVSKIDLLVSHSSAIFPTLLILLNANKEAIARQKALKSCQPAQQDGHKLAASAAAAANNGNNQHDIVIDDIRLIGGADSTIGNNVNRSANDNGFCSNGAGATEGAENDEDSDEGASDDDDETFVDAKDETDNNNNSNNGRGSNTANNRDGDDLAKPPAPSVGGAQLSETGTGAAKGRARGRAARRQRRSEEVIVEFDEPIEVRAVALFNPAGHRLPKSMKPTWFKCGSVHVYQHKLGRSLFRKMGPAFLTVVGVPVRVDNMDNVMLSATVMRNSKCQRVVKQLEQLSEMKIPTLLVFSENDKLIEKEIFYEMTQFMRLDSDKFDIFNNDGDIELSQSQTDDWIRVMVFKAGGHYAYSNYAKTVNKAVSDLLKRVVN